MRIKGQCTPISLNLELLGSEDWKNLGPDVQSHVLSHVQPCDVSHEGQPPIFHLVRVTPACGDKKAIPTIVILKTMDTSDAELESALEAEIASRQRWTASMLLTIASCMI